MLRFKRFLYLLLASAGIVGTSFTPVHADSRSAELHPQPIYAGDSVELRYTFPPCTILQDNHDGLQTEIRRTDTEVVVLLSTIVTPCAPDAPSTSSIPLVLGEFSSGTYHVRVFEVFALASFPDDTQDVTPSISLDLRVLGVVEPVPALSATACVFLFFALLVFGRSYSLKRSQA